MAIRTRPRPQIALDFERKPFYTVAEVSEILGISDETIRKRIHEGLLFAVVLGPKLFRIPLGGLLNFMGEKPEIHWTRNTAAHVDSQTDDPEDEADHGDVE